MSVVAVRHVPRITQIEPLGTIRIDVDVHPRLILDELPDHRLVGTVTILGLDSPILIDGVADQAKEGFPSGCPKAGKLVFEDGATCPVNKGVPHVNTGVIPLIRFPVTRPIMLRSCPKVIRKIREDLGHLLLSCPEVVNAEDLRSLDNPLPILL
jgi:hypothetical protein